MSSTPLSAELLGDQLEERSNQLRATLPIGRVVGPEVVAALAVHLMTNTALTGAPYDIDGGQQLVSRSYRLLLLLCGGFCSCRLVRLAR